MKPLVNLPDANVSVRVSGEERAILAARAAKRGQSIQEYLRAIMFDSPRADLDVHIAGVSVGLNFLESRLAAVEAALLRIEGHLERVKLEHQIIDSKLDIAKLGG